MAPLLFGVVSDHVFGGGRSGLQWTFGIMLVAMAGSGVILLRALRTYPQDVATAAGSMLPPAPAGRPAAGRWPRSRRCTCSSPPRLWPQPAPPATLRVARPGTA